MAARPPSSTGWRLYVDIGNFAVKYGLRRPGDWAGFGSHPHDFVDASEADFSAETDDGTEEIIGAIVTAMWEAQLVGASCEGILLSCTADGAEDFIATLGAELGVPLRRLGHDVQADLPTGYRDPGELGPDRLANAIAARHLYGTPVVVIDCGTCITSEVIDAGGTLVGGNIGAGLPVLSAGLMSVSERLRQALETVLEAEPEHLVGHSTAEAIAYGLLLQLSGTADRFVLEGLVALDLDDTQVVVTGGDGSACAQFMAEESAFDPMLTLEGLRLIDGYA